MTTGDIAMGNFGVMYVLGGFLGICFQSENIGNTSTLLKDEFLGLTSRIGSDVNSSISFAQSAIKKLR
ncbi:MAG: hypothetical protein LBH58_08615 [Tannerellaceae bacterium]|nr:hypothetical protein [Tannerellaceae bacterium]